MAKQGRKKQTGVEFVSRRSTNNKNNNKNAVLSKNETVGPNNVISMKGKNKKTFVPTATSMTPTEIARIDIYQQKQANWDADKSMIPSTRPIEKVTEEAWTDKINRTPLKDENTDNDQERGITSMQNRNVPTITPPVQDRFDRLRQKQNNWDADNNDAPAYSIATKGVPVEEDRNDTSTPSLLSALGTIVRTKRCSRGSKQYNRSVLRTCRRQDDQEEEQKDEEEEEEAEEYVSGELVPGAHAVCDARQERRTKGVLTSHDPDDLPELSIPSNAIPTKTYLALKHVKQYAEAKRIQLNEISKTERIAACTVFCCILIASIIAFVVVTVVDSTNEKHTNNNNKNDANTTMSPQAPTSTPFTLPKKLNEILNFIDLNDVAYVLINDTNLDVNIIDYEGIQNDITELPQRRAMSWILYNDTNYNKKEDDIGIRWTLASIYYSFQQEYGSSTSNDSTWIDNTNWLSTNHHVCSWYGITCNYQETIITERDLYQNNLSGTIPIEFTLLSNVRFLSLSHNNLIGTIPGIVFGTIPYLQTLQLNNNQLTGTIPESLRSDDSDVRLYLKNNNLHGTFPSEWCRDRQLVRFASYDCEKITNTTCRPEMGGCRPKESGRH